MKNTLTKEAIISFLWQHFLLLITLYIMTLGVAICVRSQLGSSVISVLPYVFECAGNSNINIPNLSIGQYTYIMNIILVMGQILVLRKEFEWVQLLQLVIGFIFGTLIDINMFITNWLQPNIFWQCALTQIMGCTILGFGIATEIRCGSVTMPGEGFPVAISKVTHKEFSKVKIAVDITLVCLGIFCCFIFFNEWKWNIVGIGTLFAMFYVGATVRFFSKHLNWFDKILHYQSNFRKVLYGLAKYIHKN